MECSSNFETVVETPVMAIENELQREGVDYL